MKGCAYEGGDKLTGTCVQPIVDPLLASVVGLALDQFVLVVWELQVDPSSVDVQPVRATS